ncbi:hypothetical protein GQ457_05G005960 [Hibiscus cannabinus]
MAGFLKPMSITGSKIDELRLRGSNWGHHPTMLDQNKRRKLSHRMERRPSPPGIPLYQHNPAPRAEDLCMVGSASGDEHLSGKMGMPGCYDIYDRQKTMAGCANRTSKSRWKSSAPNHVPFCAPIKISEFRV